VSYALDAVGMHYGAAEVLAGITARFQPGELAAIVGPNGAGKSTLIGIMAGLRHGYTGRCSYRDRDIRAWNRRAFARHVSFVPQSLKVDFPFTAEQVVTMGRTPYGGGLFETDEDREAVEQAMRTTDTLAFRNRDFRSLSGGERQRVVIASALAQSPEALLLDEPTTYLDLKHQLETYRLLRELARGGILAIAITHDLNLALTYADRALMLSDGRLVADGPPRDVLTADRIHEVFGVTAYLRSGTDHQRAWLVYDR
jgi:iron complex transport system ATP-binding protein